MRRNASCSWTVLPEGSDGQPSVRTALLCAMLIYSVSQVETDRWILDILTLSIFRYIFRINASIGKNEQGRKLQVTKKVSLGCMCMIWSSHASRPDTYLNIKVEEEATGGLIHKMHFQHYNIIMLSKCSRLVEFLCFKLANSILSVKEAMRNWNSQVSFFILSVRQSQLATCICNNYMLSTHNCLLLRIDWMIAVL